jgi:hypothetical protein
LSSSSGNHPARAASSRAAAFSSSFSASNWSHCASLSAESAGFEMGHIFSSSPRSVA